MGKSKKVVSDVRDRIRKNKFVTRSGNVIKVNRSILQRWVGHKDAKEKRKAEALQTLPKNKILRFFARFEPRRMARYWFSRDGGIMALKIIGVGAAAGFLLLVGLFAYFRKDLPNLKDISGDNIGGSTRYYDKTGQTLLWEDYDAVKRVPVKGNDISQVMKDATVAVEDKDFFKHGGFDVRGILRAGMNNAFGHSGTQGGSTITQQLVKLTQDWSQQRTVTRKIKELILAVELERSYSKQDILTGYLNTAPYGGIEYGVEAASRDYFNKSAKDLTLPEAAFLASIPQSPRYYSPYSSDFDKGMLVGREQYVLDLMAEQGKITKKQRDEAKKTDILAEVKPRQPKYDGIKAPWFVIAAKKQLEDKFGDQTVKRGGWKVITTLDMNLQNLAEQQVQKGLAQVRRQGGDTAAFAAEDVKTGQMVALVGGADFTDQDHGQINYAQTPLPPGSSFKPYDYTALIEQNNNVGAGSVIFDSQGVLPGYPCTNKALPKNGGNCLQDYDFRYPGPLSLRYALGGSRNVPAVKAMLINGVDKTIGIADKLMGGPDFGQTSNSAYGYKCFLDEKLTKTGPCYASSAIGDGAYLHLDEHVNGYASISRLGNYLPQTYILKITDAANKTVDEWKPTKGTQVVRQDAAYIVANMLSDPNASYFPAGRKPHRYKGWNFGMKTGTTNDGKDGWMMGFSTQYAAGVWVGYHSRQKVMAGPMENMTQPIWQGWMDAAHDNLQPQNWTQPSDIQTLPAFVVHDHVGIGSVEPSPSTDIFPSWYQQPKKASNANRTIDIISNKLATDCTPTLAKKSTNEAAANTFSIDPFAGGGTANQSADAQDDVHLCGDAKPSVTLTVPPGAVCTNSCVFTATVTQGTHPISSDQYKGTVNFIIDGQTVQSFTVDTSPSTVSFTYNVTTSGTKTVSAQVIDSVLYDTTDSATVTFSGGGTGGGVPPATNLNLQVNKKGPTKVQFSWTSYPGTASYQLCYIGLSPGTTSGCPPVNSNQNSSGDIGPLPPGSYSATVKALDGGGNTLSSSSASFNMP